MCRCGAKLLLDQCDEPRDPLGASVPVLQQRHSRVFPRTTVIIIEGTLLAAPSCSHAEPVSTQRTLQGDGKIVFEASQPHILINRAADPLLAGIQVRCHNENRGDGSHEKSAKKDREDRDHNSSRECGGVEVAVPHR
tara:strand:- start:178 stop:588 length:411 start_codon:yes stop_codon:yes gene_type:complete